MRDEATVVAVAPVGSVVAWPVVGAVSSSRMVTVAGGPYWKFGFTSQPPPWLSVTVKVSSGSGTESFVVAIVIVWLVPLLNMTRWSKAT